MGADLKKDRPAGLTPTEKPLINEDKSNQIQIEFEREKTAI